MGEKNQVYRVDLLNLEIDSLDLEKSGTVKIGCAFYCLGTAHRIPINIRIKDEKKMIREFYGSLFDYLKSSDFNETMNETEYEIANKSRLENEITDFFLKIKIILEKQQEEKLNPFDYAMVSTNRLDFYNPEFSLSNKSLKEKVEILLKKAESDIRDGYFAPAKDLLEKILILDTENKEAFALKGVCHRERGESEQALAAFKSWLDLAEPDEKKPYFNYGDMLLQLKKYEQAEKVYESFLKIFSCDIDGYIELAQVRYLLEKEYIELLKKAEEIDRVVFSDEILHNFIFTLEKGGLGEQMDIKLGAAFLGAEPEFIQELVEKDIIPFRLIGNQPVLYEFELERWAKVMNHFNLLNFQFLIDKKAVQKLKSLRESMPMVNRALPGSDRRKRSSRRQAKKRTLEGEGQQRLFDDS